MNKLWVTKNKFYKINISRNLLNQWIIVCWWGSLITKRGNNKKTLAKNYEEAYNFLKLISKRRIAHGYIEVF